MSKHWAVGVAAAALLFGCSSEETVAGDGCESCHRPETGGIEEPHALFAVSCVDCHGGDGEGTTIGEAHVASPFGDRNVRQLSTAEIAAADPAYLRFVNPGDPRAAAAGCGGQNGKAGSTGCHQMIVEHSATSVHSTLAGMINVPRYGAGLNAMRAPSHAPQAITDPMFEAGRDYTYASLTALQLPSIDGLDGDDAAVFLEHALTKACSGCHIGVYGAPGVEGRAADHFASGCTACHMHYDQKALSVSGDPFADRGAPGHPVRHVIARSVPDEQCEHCHYTSDRIGLNYKGWRERDASDDELTLANAELNTEPIHGRPAGSYVIDEDTRDTVDLTPPDAHRTLGLGCVDCHLSQDGHGDGSIKPHMAREVSIECEDCHGTFDARAGASGTFMTSGGAPIARLRKEGDRIILRGALSGRDHLVPQVTDVRQSASSDAAHLQRNHGELECYACHTAWMPNYYRVDRKLDLREMAIDPISGTMTAGRVNETNTLAGIGELYLAQNPDGKIGTFMVENNFFSVVVSCNPLTSTGTCTQDREGLGFGEAIVDAYVGQNVDGLPGFEWRPVFAHTTANRARVQPCERCHSRLFESDPRRPRATYGFGSGKFQSPVGSSTIPIDLTRMVDARGEPTVAFGHLLTTPVNGDRINKALNLKVTP